MHVTPARSDRVGKSSSSPAQSVPRDGDIVVTRESKCALRYTVHQVPAVSQQFGSEVRDDAVRLARGFAQAHAVDLWYREDGIYKLLEVYRRRATLA